MKLFKLFIKLPSQRLFARTCISVKHNKYLYAYFIILTTQVNHLARSTRKLDIRKTTSCLCTCGKSCLIAFFLRI